MAYPAYPTLPSGKNLDSKKFSISVPDDNTVRKETEGGYVVTRPRSTRTNPVTWSCGYTHITEADRLVLMNFRRTVKDGAVIFTWVNPQDLVTYYVRYTGPLTFQYVGIGTSQKWDCSFSLEQA